MSAIGVALRLGIFAIIAVTRSAGLARRLQLNNMTPSYFTTQEMEQARKQFGIDCALVYWSISTSIMSPASEYGALLIEGKPFIYIPETDQLLREDFLQWIKEQRKAKRDLEVENEQRKQLDLI